MSKKIFTFLLLTVFMLAQFSIASATAVAGTVSITSLPTFTKIANVGVGWTAAGMTSAGAKNILLWAREVPAAAYATTECQTVSSINGISDASGTFSYDFAATALALANGDQVEFTITVDDKDCASGPALPAGTSVMGTSYIDSEPVEGLKGNPPSITGLAPTADTAICNTFEYWALASDSYGLPAGTAYSGFDKWVTVVTGTFAPPAPEGTANDLLSWKFTFPATATGTWGAGVGAFDKAGNTVFIPFRTATPIAAAETTDCATFSDVSGHEDEVYIRYLATLHLINGFSDGSFGPDKTLSRAEAATLFEISNAYVPTGLPTSAPAGCDFSDVAASDWFAGWVWQACKDGFMNGVGGGLFDPNNLLTRGQIVTIFNNVANANPALYSGFINTKNVVNMLWGFSLLIPIRTAAWTDVPVGAYYATPVIEAYNLGVVDGTSANTFSPDQPVTRGEFAKMLYRALSIIG